MDEETWDWVFIFILAVLLISPFFGIALVKSEMVNEYYQNRNMSPRIEIPFSGEIVPAIGAGEYRYNTYTISLYNVNNKTMRIVEPPDFGGFLPIRGKQTTFEVSGENWMMPFYHANPCVPTHIFVYNETHYEHAVINQTCLCM